MKNRERSRNTHDGGGEGTGGKDAGVKFYVYKYLPRFAQEIETSAGGRERRSFILLSSSSFGKKNKASARKMEFSPGVCAVCAKKRKSPGESPITKGGQQQLPRSLFFLLSTSFLSPFWKPVPIAERRGGEFGGGQWGEGGGGGGGIWASPSTAEEKEFEYSFSPPLESTAAGRACLLLPFLPPPNGGHPPPTSETVRSATGKNEKNLFRNFRFAADSRPTPTQQGNKIWSDISFLVCAGYARCIFDNCVTCASLLVWAASTSTV